MALLVRKINKAKWHQVNIEETFDVSADAITNCLKTTNNTLSVWEIESSDQIKNVALAMVALQDTLDTIDLITLELDFFSNNDIEVKETPGATPVVSLIETHRDLSDLTYFKIGILKDHVVEQLRKNKIERFTVAMLKQILTEAINNKLLTLDSLKEGVKKKLSL